MLAFSQNALPMKKHNNKKYFTWSNDENLNKLLTLNKAINSGNFSLENMREQEKNLIKNVSETQNKIIEIENDLNFYKKVLRVAQKVFVQNQQYTPEELKFLQENKITKENIPAVEKFIEKNQADIASLKENFEKNKSQLEKLTAEIKFCDEVFAKTYVQKLMQIEADRQTAEYRPKS
jgi:chromosome segregation ATPase